MALRTLRLGHAARSSGLLACRPAAVATDHVRWVETVVGPGAPNLALPFEQRGLPTTKSNYATETVFNTVASGTIEEARSKTLALVRDTLKSLPRMNEDYEMDLTKKDVMRAVRQDIESHKHIKDIKTIDVLLFKGRQHLEEVRLQYKVRAQLHYFFSRPDHSVKAAIAGNEEQESDFLTRFYAGTA